MLDRFSKSTQISNFMKIRRVGAELFHADGRTDKHDEANSCFSQFCESVKKLHYAYVVSHCETRNQQRLFSKTTLTG